jgi:hypothetical protein
MHAMHRPPKPRRRSRKISSCCWWERGPGQSCTKRDPRRQLLLWFYIARLDHADNHVTDGRTNPKLGLAFARPLNHKSCQLPDSRRPSSRTLGTHGDIQNLTCALTCSCVIASQFPPEPTVRFIARPAIDPSSTQLSLSLARAHRKLCISIALCLLEKLRRDNAASPPSPAHNRPSSKTLPPAPQAPAQRHRPARPISARAVATIAVASLALHPPPLALLSSRQAEVKSSLTIVQLVSFAGVISHIYTRRPRQTRAFGVDARQTPLLGSAPITRTQRHASLPLRCARKTSNRHLTQPSNQPNHTLGLALARTTTDLIPRLSSCAACSLSSQSATYTVVAVATTHSNLARRNCLQARICCHAVGRVSASASAWSWRSGR